jgi:flagellar basal-body rod protein FlgF
MDPLTTTAASGLRSRLEALDLLANNMANLSTAGYKADREAYTTYLNEASAEAQRSGFGRAQTLSPLVEGQWVDLTQGTLTQTDNPFDLALSGSGFLVADGPTGPLLSRGGAIQVDSEGRITTSDGHELHTIDPKRIKANPLLPVQVDPDGTVRQQDVPLGRLKLVSAPGPEALSRRQGAYFAIDAPAELRQGALESSNLGPSEAAIRLVQVLRQFETLQKAMQIGGEMNRRSVEEVARVHS